MFNSRTCQYHRLANLALLILSLTSAVSALAQQQSASQRDTTSHATWTAADDHKNMMEQLGIRALRPGPSGNEQDANHANYDETMANPFPTLPDVLTLKNGAARHDAARSGRSGAPRSSKTSSAKCYGRVPKNVPKVTWTRDRDRHAAPSADGVSSRSSSSVTSTTRRFRRSPSTSRSRSSLPADAKGPVPLMIMFRPGGTRRRRSADRAPPARSGRVHSRRRHLRPVATRRHHGAAHRRRMGLRVLESDERAGRQRRRPHARASSVSSNKGQPRKPDDWGALRAWAWGASRALDYLETDPAVDAKQVGIEGVSRYGKAALVDDGVRPALRGRAHRLVGRRRREAASPQLRARRSRASPGSGEYHWMAGNFLKYGASDATFGSKTPNDLPVDSHELIALCAPRLTFVSYGIPEKGDAKWLDQQGSFMATVAAQPVFRLLGAQDLGVADDYLTAKMPPVNVGLLDGQLAWRQHDGGHTDAPNWKYFLSVGRRSFQATLHAAPRADHRAGVASRRRRMPISSRIRPTSLRRAPTRTRCSRISSCSRSARREGSTSTSRATRSRVAGAQPTIRSSSPTGSQLLRLECRRLRLGRRPHREHALAPRERRARWREPEGHRPPRRHEQCRQGARRRRARSPTSRAASGRCVELCRRKAPNATIILTGIFPRNDSSAVMPRDRSHQRRTSRAFRRRQAAFATSTSTTSSPTAMASCSTG